MDIGQGSLIAGMNAFKMAMVAETVIAVDNTAKNIVAYAKLTHGMQGGVTSGAGKNVFQNQTYDLETSIYSEAPKVNGNVIETNVRATMDYAEAIEFGSSTNRPYPFVKPSVEANAKVLTLELRLASVRASR